MRLHKNCTIFFILAYCESQELGNSGLQKHQMPIEENDISLQPNIEPIYENINTYNRTQCSKIRIKVQY